VDTPVPRARGCHHAFGAARSGRFAPRHSPIAEELGDYTSEDIAYVHATSTRHNRRARWPHGDPPRLRTVSYEEDDLFESADVSDEDFVLYYDDDSADCIPEPSPQHRARGSPAHPRRTAVLDRRSPHWLPPPDYTRPRGHDDESAYFLGGLVEEMQHCHRRRHATWARATPRYAPHHSIPLLTDTRAPLQSRAFFVDRRSVPMSFSCERSRAAHAHLLFRGLR